MEQFVKSSWDFSLAKKWIESRLLREEAQQDAKQGLKKGLQ